MTSTAGASFGIVDVNTGKAGDPTVPVFPTEKAIWAGTCDLSSGSTADGGVGTPPSLRGHCIDGGATSNGDVGIDVPWPLGDEPTWRLDPVLQAGAHPDATASFFFNYIDGQADGSVKDIIVKLPPGVVGNPESLPKCSAAAAQAVPPDCPASTQAGISTLAFPSGIEASEVGGFQTKPVYNIEARDTVTAEFIVGYVATFFNVPITARGRTNGDYGIDTLALLIPEFTPLGGALTTLWGVPWANSHDAYRLDGLKMPANDGKQSGHNYTATGYPEAFRKSYEPSWGPIMPFFTNPTECSGEPLPVSLDADSWQDPVFDGGSYITGVSEAPPLTGCEDVEFDPAISLKPTVAVADSPSGLDVTLSIPQNNDPPAEIPGNADLAHDPADDTGAPAYWKTPAGIASAHLKDTIVQLPKGTSFNPAAANGLEGCTTEQIGLVTTKPKVTFNNDPIACPDNSKIGTLEIDSPLLADPLLGGVYAAPQDDNPFPGTLTAIYLVSQDEERGLSIKLAGKVDLDPQTGQISTTFVDNPQLPFNHFTLHLKSGPRAPLNTPPVCGHFENAADMVPWSFPDSGPVATFHDPFDILSAPSGLGCVGEPEDRVFGPGFEAGSTNTQAGASTNFVLNVTRNDGHQEVSALNIDMPPGLVANLTDTPFCPEGAIASVAQKTGLEETQEPSCPPKSLVGVVNSLAGAGPLPLPTPGRLYFAGPFDPDGAGPLARAPLSVAAIVPAIAGGTLNRPAFDLGNLVVRSAIYVDRDDAGVHVSAGRLPYIVGGVPLRVRKISVELNKPSFTVNPTSCDPLALGGTIGGTADPFDPADDTAVAVSNRFQVGGCEKLGFKPNLKLKLTGGTKRAANPKLRAELNARPGDANISRAAVTLPHSAFLDQSHIRTVCTRVQFAAKACPAGSIYGSARAWTPLFAQPLEGPVYLRSSNNPLPDLVADLRGLVDIELVGRTDSVNESLRNTFDVVPDAPVSRFVLELQGGKKGLIENSRNLCVGVNRATVRFSAHNGLKRNFRPAVKDDCEGKKARKGGKAGSKGKGAKGKGAAKGKSKPGRR